MEVNDIYTAIEEGDEDNEPSDDGTQAEEGNSKN